MNYSNFKQQKKPKIYLRMTEEKVQLDKFTYNEVLEASMAYFNGDELAATTWINKYAIKDHEGNFSEKSPDDMHRRMAKEFGRIESKYAQQTYNTELLSNYGKNRKSG